MLILKEGLVFFGLFFTNLVLLKTKKKQFGLFCFFKRKKGLYRIDVGARTATALEIYRAKVGMKAATVAKKMEMTPQSFTRLLKPSSNVIVAMLDRFAKAVGKRLVITFE